MEESSKGLIFGSILIPLFIFVLILVCCCAKCRKENKGYVLSNGDPVVSEQSLLNQAVHPHYTDEPPQQCPRNCQSRPLLPPYYSPVPTSYQHNPVSQIYSNPEAPPPPYDSLTFGAPPYKN